MSRTMRLLLDTHILIWALTQPERLTPTAAALMLDERPDKMFSAVSVLEVAIKFALARPDFTLGPDQLVAFAAEAGFREAPVNSMAAARVAKLPPNHPDPFDRLLVAQAIELDATLLTADAKLAAYAPQVCKPL